MSSSTILEAFSSVWNRIIGQSGGGDKRRGPGRGGSLAGAGLALLLPCAAPAQSPHTGIIGEDDRQVIGEPGWPWDAIGRIERGGRGFCTGTLIAPDRVLTAAHCLWNAERGRLFPPEQIHFIAGFRQGAFVAHGRAARYQTDPGLRFVDGAPARLADDWAIIELTARIEAIRPIPIQAETGGGVGEVLARAGYSRDRPYLPTLVPSCRALGRLADQPVILHDCDSTFGDSGSPILVQSGEAWWVVALQVAVIDRADGIVGAAVRLEQRLPADILRPRESE